MPQWLSLENKSKGKVHDMQSFDVPLEQVEQVEWHFKQLFPFKNKPLADEHEPQWPSLE
jgi:hypothetical protein